jgi:hypothetical protein
VLCRLIRRILLSRLGFCPAEQRPPAAVGVAGLVAGAGLIRLCSWPGRALGHQLGAGAWQVVIWIGGPAGQQVLLGGSAAGSGGDDGRLHLTLRSTAIVAWRLPVHVLSVSDYVPVEHARTGNDYGL